MRTSDSSVRTDRLHSRNSFTAAASNRLGLLERLRRLLFRPKLLIAPAVALAFACGGMVFGEDIINVGSSSAPSPYTMTDADNGKSIVFTGSKQDFVDGNPTSIKLSGGSETSGIYNGVDSILNLTNKADAFGIVDIKDCILGDPDYRSLTILGTYDSQVKFSDEDLKELGDDVWVDWFSRNMSLIGQTDGGITTPGKLAVNMATFSFQTSLDVLNGSEAYLYGYTNFQNAYYLKPGGEYAFVGEDIEYVGVGNGNFGVFKNQNITISGEDSKVYSNTSILKQVNLNIVDGGELVLTDINYEYGDDQSSKTVGNITPYIITYDENEVPTKLLYNNAKEYMDAMLIIRYDDDGNPISGYEQADSGIYSGNGDINIDSFYINAVDTFDEVYDTKNYAFITGDQQEWKGDTTVNNGTLILRTIGLIGEDTIFGSEDQGTLTIKGYQLEFDNVEKNYSVITNGKIMFYKCDGAEFFQTETMRLIPTVQADTITFEGGHTVKDSSGRDIVVNNKSYRTNGATLWFNTVSVPDWNNPNIIDIGTDRTVATMNANTINFSSENVIWYDKVSQLNETADVIVELNADTITVDGLTIEDSNINTLNSVFDKPLVSAAAIKNTETGENGYDIHANVIDIEKFASQQKMSSKEIKFAQQMDVNRHNSSGELSHSNHILYEALYNEDNIDKVRQTIHNLARYTGPRASSAGFIGPMGSAFNMSGGGLSGGLGGLTGASSRGQSMEDASVISDKVQTDNLTDSVFANQPDSGAGSIGASSGSSELNESAWVSFTHTSINGYGYKADEMQFDGYDVRRSGILGGVRKQFNGTTSGGILFAYSDPEVNQNGVYEGYNSSYYSDMDMHDFQFALHLEKVFCDYWEAAFFLGGGTQSMDWERHVYDESSRNDNKNFDFEGESTGNTLTFTAYLARRLEMSDCWTLRPTIGLDSEHSWLFGFDEQHVGANTTFDAYSMLGATQAYCYKTIEYSRNTARVGLSSTWHGPEGRGGMTARVFYGVKLGGDDSAHVDYVSLDTSDRYVDMESHVMGGESINVGTGGYWYLNPSKTLTLTADINGIWYKNATTQNVTGGISWRF